MLWIWAEAERDLSETLRYVATCRAVSHNRVAEVCRSLSETANAVNSFDENIAVVEPGQTRKEESNRPSKDDTATGGTKIL